MQKLNDNKIKIIHRNGQSVSGPWTLKKGYTLFGLLNFPKVQTFGKNTPTVLKEPVAKPPHPPIPQTDLTAVRNWVALEEKIVHGYKEQKTAQSKSVVALSKTPEKQSLPAFETFSTQTAISSSPSILKLKDPLLGPERTFLILERFLLVLGWLVAGALVFLFVQETFLSREASQKLSQAQNEKKRLEQSYATLKNISEDQVTEMKWLNSELQDTTSELKAAKSELKAARSEITVLQSTAQTQNAIVNALKAQNQAFEKIMGQGGVSALSGAAAGLSQERFLTEGTSMLQGEVTSINERQGFVVISVGSDQGVHPGRWITISRGGRGLAVGRIDRVYSTMSVALLRNSNMLRVIQEGDGVSFS